MVRNLTPIVRKAFTCLINPRIGKPSPLSAAARPPPPPGCPLHSVDALSPHAAVSCPGTHSTPSRSSELGSRSPPPPRRCPPCPALSLLPLSPQLGCSGSCTSCKPQAVREGVLSAHLPPRKHQKNCRQ